MSQKLLGGFRKNCAMSRLMLGVVCLPRGLAPLVKKHEGLEEMVLEGVRLVSVSEDSHRQLSGHMRLSITHLVEVNQLTVPLH